MHLVPGLPAETARLAGSILVASLWQGPLLAVAVWLCLRLVPYARPGLRHLLWTAVLCVLCVLPLIESFPPAQQATSSHAALLHMDVRWSLAAAAIWIAASIVRLGGLAFHALRLRSLLACAVPVVPSPSINTLLRSCSRSVQLRTSTELERPGVLGFFAPCILIPASLYRQITEPELEQIILHELEHLRRRDDWTNLLQKLSLILFPLHPVLLWVERRLCLERELACDEGVVRRTGAPTRYAACLARLAEHGLDRRALSLALGVMERQSELARRVFRILRSTAEASPRQARALAATIVLLLLGGSLGLAHCPQLIAFVPNEMQSSSAALLDHGRAFPSLPTRTYSASFSHPAFLEASFSPPPRRSHPSKFRPRRQSPRNASSKVKTLAILSTLPEPTLLTLAEPASEFTAIPVPSLATPTRVHYQLVRVDGGWILLQL